MNAAGWAEPANTDGQRRSPAGGDSEKKKKKQGPLEPEQQPGKELDKTGSSRVQSRIFFSCFC